MERKPDQKELGEGVNEFWPRDPAAPGSPVSLADIEIHPEFQGIAKTFASFAAEDYRSEGGEVRDEEYFARFLNPDGVVDENGSARFSHGDPGSEGYFNIPPGYWRRRPS